MKIANPTSIAATSVSAILSLILPASALPADEGLRSNHSPPAIERPRDERRWTDPLLSDPILDTAKWGPGDPDLVARQFHIPLSSRADNAPPRPSPSTDASCPECASDRLAGRSGPASHR